VPIVSSELGVIMMIAAHRLQGARIPRFTWLLHLGEGSTCSHQAVRTRVGGEGEIGHHRF
jgi:hypothetical protein